ncbi:MAG: fatty acid desaturase [Candidatus Moraniibacteriota bacterium]
MDISNVVSLLNSRLIDLPWWGYVVVALVLTHVTIACVTIFLHRAQAHRALELHPIASHFFRFWLWLTTGMVTKEWVAIHRKHHAKVETLEDPHSPQTRGLSAVFWRGSELYRDEAKNSETIEKYGHGTPNDWIERNLYTRFSWQGVGLMLAIDLTLFGPIGATIWAVQMMWIPVMAAGIINGVGHYWGYRNFETFDPPDTSTNIVPWGIIIGGEELHNNHHAYGTSAKLSSKWYEFDIGWLYIRVLMALKLAWNVRVPPEIESRSGVPEADLEALKAVIQHRFAILKNYGRELRKVTAREIKELRPLYEDDLGRKRKHHIRELLRKEDESLGPEERQELELILEHRPTLRTIRTMRLRLRSLGARSRLSNEQLLERFREWCRQAEASGIHALGEFALRLKGYRLRK